MLQFDRMIYDAAGRLKGTRHDRAGAGEDHDECFSYDGGGRLVAAFTAMLSGAVSGGPQCAVTPNPGASGYQESFDVDDIGNVTVGPNGVYTYPTSGAGSVRPHAPFTAGTTTMVWDTQGRLSSSTSPTTSTTSGGGGGSGGGTPVCTSAVVYVERVSGCQCQLAVVFDGCRGPGPYRRVNLDGDCGVDGRL